MSFTKFVFCLVSSLILLFSSQITWGQEIGKNIYRVSSEKEWEIAISELSDPSLREVELNILESLTIESISLNLPHLKIIHIIGKNPAVVMTINSITVFGKSQITISNLSINGTGVSDLPLIKATDFQGELNFFNVNLQSQTPILNIEGKKGLGEITIENSIFQSEQANAATFIISSFNKFKVENSLLDVSNMFFENISSFSLSKSNLQIQETLQLSGASKINLSQNTINFVNGGLNITNSPTNIGASNRISNGSNYEVVNNMISSLNGTAVLLDGVDNVFFVHNSVKGSVGFQAIQLGEATLKNNIFYGLDGFSWEATVGGTNLELDFNIYHSKSGLLAKLNQNVWENLADWQSEKPNYNFNSLEGDPIFASAGDLHIHGLLPLNMGDGSVGIALDFDGDPRPMPLGGQVDIGADEYMPPIIDGVLSNIFVDDLNCNAAGYELKTVIENFGTANIPASTPVDFQVYNGVATQLFSTATTKDIQPGEVDTIAVTILNYPAGRILSIAGVLQIPGDNRLDNNQMTVSISLAPSIASMADSIYFCENELGLTLEVESPSNFPIIWYEQQLGQIPSGLNSFFVQNNFSAPTNKDYFAGVMSTPGKISTGLSGRDTVNSCNLTILPKRNIAITEITVVPIENGWSLLNVFFRKSPSTTWQLVYSQNDLLQANRPRTIQLNTAQILLENEIGEIRITAQSGARLRGAKMEDNSDQVIENTDLGLTSFTQSPLAGAILQEGMFSGIISYLTEPCPNMRKKTTVFAIEDTVYAVFNKFQQQDGSIIFDATGSIGNRFFWEFGDATTATGKQVTHHFFNNKDYLVKLTVFNDTCSLSYSYSRSIPGSLSSFLDSKELAIDVFPNPATDYIEVTFPASASDIYSFTIANSLGETIKSGVFENDLEKSKKIDLKMFSSGVYYLVILNSNLNKVSTKKFVKL